MDKRALASQTLQKARRGEALTPRDIDAFVGVYYRSKGRLWCARKLKQSASRIGTSAERLDLRFADYPGYVTFFQVARAANLESHRVARQIEKVAPPHVLKKVKVSGGGFIHLVAEAWAEAYIAVWTAFNQKREGGVSVTQAAESLGVGHVGLRRALRGQPSSYLEAVRGVELLTEPYASRPRDFISASDLELIRKRLLKQAKLPGVSVKTLTHDLKVSQTTISTYLSRYMPERRHLVRRGVQITYIPPSVAAQIRKDVRAKHPDP